MRVLARIIDFILVGVVNRLVTSIVVTGAMGLDGAGVNNYGVAEGYAGSALSGVIGAAIGLTYFALMESRTGRTVGKVLFKMRTEGPNAGPPSLEVAVRRNFWVALSALAVVPMIGSLVGAIGEVVIVILIMVTIYQSPTRQGWHDRFAGGTRVVRAI